MNRNWIHGLLFSLLSVVFLFILHHLPINQIFIDPFSEAIKNHDVMDVALSRFRNHKAVKFDNRIFILNSESTNRSDIAQALSRILEDDVKGVGVDLLFEKDSITEVDSSLQKLFASSKVVLGNILSETEDPETHEKHFFIKETSDEFFTTGADQSYVNLGSNDGFTVRTFKPKLEMEGKKHYAFAVKMAAKLDPSVKQQIVDRGNKTEWINFRRMQPGDINMKYPVNQDSLIHYQMTSVGDFLQDSLRYPSGFFKDKLVLIGFAGDGEKYISMNDRYYTPLNGIYHGRSIPDMYGVNIHANIISMLLDKDYIYEIPEKLLYLFSFFLFLLNFFIFKYIMKRNFFFTLITVRVVQLIEFIILFGLSLILMSEYNIKMGFVLVITAVIISFEVFEFFDHKLLHLKLFNKKNSHHEELH